MAFTDEEAREINVKIVWYSASPNTAGQLVRFIGERTQPDLNTNVPVIFGAPAASPADALARGRALGFPDADAVPIDTQTGAGVFEAFKGIAKKLLSSLGGRPTVSRATPAPGTRPLVIP